MTLRTEVLNKYKLPYAAQACIVICSRPNNSGRFLVLQSGEIEELDYEIPKLKYDHFNYRGAFFDTDAGFGCVFDHQIVEYDLNKGLFNEYTFKAPLPLDNFQRETGPLGTAFRISNTELIVNLEDYFYKFKGSLFTKVYLDTDKASYDSFLFSMTKSKDSNIADCSAAYINNRTLFHRCEYFKMLRDNPNDLSEFCELNNGNINVLSETSKGIGRFSTDCSHLLLKTYSKPFKLEFYSLAGEKEIEIALAPKRVIGDIDNKYLSHFDKFNDRLWLAKDFDVTETFLMAVS